MVLVSLPTGRTGSLMILQRHCSGTLVFSKYLTSMCSAEAQTWRLSPRSFSMLTSSLPPILQNDQRARPLSLRQVPPRRHSISIIHQHSSISLHPSTLVSVAPFPLSSSSHQSSTHNNNTSSSSPWTNSSLQHRVRRSCVQTASQQHGMHRHRYVQTTFYHARTFTHPSSLPTTLRS
jgi:hypothetical protein